MRQVKSFFIKGFAIWFVAGMTIGLASGCGSTEVPVAKGTPPAEYPKAPVASELPKKGPKTPGGSAGMKYNPGNPSEKLQ
jgi:hypothetical protein